MRDLATSVVVSTILMMVIFLLPDITFIRIILGLPFILFLPGYVFIATLFPGREIDWIERIALSFGLSIAIVPLIGLGLNYTPFGIRLVPITVSIYIFIILFSTSAYIRRRNLAENERFEIPSLMRLFMDFISGSSKMDKILSIILVISILVSIGILIFILVTPREGESFTELYILGSGGKACNYSTDILVGEESSLIIGLVNHEHKVINYTIEIWLVNYSIVNENISINHLYFMDSISVTLDSIPVDIEGNWTPQWERVYNFSINQSGNYKIWFLLFKEPVSPPVEMEEYAGTDYEERIIKAINGEIQSLNLNIHVKEGYL